MNNFKLRLVFA